MKALADALVYAVTFINVREDPHELNLDEDVNALESIAHCLNSASDPELDALAAAAKHAHEEEKNGPNRPDFVRDYASWMEDMFGEGWEGNERITPKAK